MLKIVKVQLHGNSYNIFAMYINEWKTPSTLTHIINSLVKNLKKTIFMFYKVHINPYESIS